MFFFTKFHKDRTIIVDFSLIAKFWACLLFFHPPFFCILYLNKTEKPSVPKAAMRKLYVENLESAENLLSFCWESVENLLRICWESAENLLRICCESADNPLRIHWESFENLLRICWESAENLPRICRKSAENLLTPQYSDYYKSDNNSINSGQDNNNNKSRA